MPEQKARKQCFERVGQGWSELKLQITQKQQKLAELEARKKQHRVRRILT